jgi:hypothetical protein
MSTFKIPNSQGQIRQGNEGDTFGELHETFNIDLVSVPGKIKTAKRLASVLKEGVDIGTPAGLTDIIIWDGKYFIFTEDETYKCSVNNDPTDPSNWSEETDIEDNDLEGTAEVFGGDLVVSRNTNIARYDGTTFTSTWWTGTVSGTALTDGYVHTLFTFRGEQETLLVTDKNFIRYYNATASNASFELQTDLVACCIDAGVSAIWAGTYNETSGNAYVYEMSIGNAQVTNAFKVDGRAVLALWVKDNIPYIVTERGSIQVFNGAGFTTIASFPFQYSENELGGVRSGQIQDSSRSRPIHPRGVDQFSESTYIYINTEDINGSYPINSRSHSGVWSFNHKTHQLTHQFAPNTGTDGYGISMTEFAYPLLVVNNQHTFLMTGVQDVTGEEHVCMTTDATSQGWFVTAEIESETIEDAYESIYHKAKTLASGDSIHTLYRTSKRDTVYGDATWTATDTFTLTDDWSGVAVGELVRVSSEYGSGEWAIVTAISFSSPTYTVTVSRDIGSISATSRVYSDNFKQIGRDPDTLSYNDNVTYVEANGEYKKIGVDEVSPWIQFMVILKGDIEYRQFISKGNAKTQLG